MTELEKAIQETAEAALGMLKKSQMAFDFSAPASPDNDNAYTLKKVSAPQWRGNGFGTTGADWELHHNGNPTGIKISNLGSYKPKHILAVDGTKVATADTMEFAKMKAMSHHKAYDRVNQSGTVSHIQQKGSLTGLPKELHDKIQAGTHRLVAAVDGSIASLERKHPQTGEWLIGTKVRQDVAKKMIPHLEKLPNVNDPYGAIGRYVAPAPEAPAKPTTYDEGLEMTDNLRNQIKQLEIQKLAIPADTRVATELDAATKLDVQMRELHKEMERVTKHMMTLV